VHKTEARKISAKKLRFGLYAAAAVTAALVFNMIVLAWRL
jgi:hypothetical protein